MLAESVYGVTIPATLSAVRHAGGMDKRMQNIYFQPRYESDSQYEQNVVKHLITVLDRVDESVTESILADLLPENWFSTTESISGYEYDVEIYPDEKPEYNEAYILGVANHRSELEEVESEDKDSRADGQITAVDENGNQTFSVIIEAKTGTDTLSSEQLTRYKEAFEAADITTIEWAAVHGTLESIQIEDEVSSFLASQYAEFLMNEEMEGVVAESSHTDESGNRTQVNQILIRYEADLGNVPYALRFLSWYRDSAEDDFELNYSAWLSSEDFKRLFGQIEDNTRKQTFVGLENDEGVREPTLRPLIEWAKEGGFGSSSDQPDFKGSHQRVVAEIKDRNDHYPELRLDNGDALRFSRLTEKASPNIRKPTHYENNEFAKLLAELQPELRESLFVDFEFVPIWNHCIQRSLDGV
jgi:hypothetical protein